MDVLREFLETSTVHGFSHIASSEKKVSKLCWLAIVVAGFSTAGYLIKTSYANWQESPLLTSITTHPADQLQS